MSIQHHVRINLEVLTVKTGGTPGSPVITHIGGQSGSIAWYHPERQAIANLFNRSNFYFIRVGRLAVPITLGRTGTGDWFLKTGTDTDGPDALLHWSGPPVQTLEVAAVQTESSIWRTETKKFLVGHSGNIEWSHDENQAVEMIQEGKLRYFIKEGDRQLWFKVENDRQGHGHLIIDREDAPLSTSQPDRKTGFKSWLQFFYW